MKTIYAAPQEGVEAFEPQVDALLQMLEHPEAFVTDESTFLDFISMFVFPTLESAQAELERVLRENNVSSTIRVEMTLLEACRILVADNPNWPSTEVQ